MKKVLCKFVVNKVTSYKPQDVRKYVNGEYKVIKENAVLVDLDATPIYEDDPTSPNYGFWAATPAGQLQLFSVMNMEDIKEGQEIDIAISYKVD